MGSRLFWSQLIAAGDSNRFRIVQRDCGRFGVGPYRSGPTSVLGSFGNGSGYHDELRKLNRSSRSRTGGPFLSASVAASIGTPTKAVVMAVVCIGVFVFYDLCHRKGPGTGIAVLDARDVVFNTPTVDIDDVRSYRSASTNAVFFW